jgi:Domain of unknown function (DUF4184)
MPLTTAHAAAAWPISRLAPSLPTAALVFGTMSPDFEYLLRLEAHSSFSHSPLGVVAFCVPVTLAVWGLFERFVRPAFSELLPPGIQAAIARDAVRPPTNSRRVALAAAAALIGALTHVAWDAFTHETGWAVPYVPMLSAVAGLPMWPTLRWYRLLQHISTIVGSVVIAIWVARAVAKVPPHNRRFAPGQAQRAVRVTLAVLLFASLAGVLNGLRAWDRGIGRILSFSAVGTMVGLALAAVGFGMARESFGWKSPPTSGTEGTGAQSSQRSDVAQ